MAPVATGRDCVVVGCGRSGTSLTAGLLARAGYRLGDRLLSADAGNPRGHFEDARLNAVNEDLIAPHADRAAKTGYSRPLAHGERWLAALPLDVHVEARAEQRARMADALPPSPFCFKDPRLCYTLEPWRPLLGDAQLVCVFRHPLATARSISRDRRYGDLTLDLEAALAVWSATYTHVLQRHRRQGDWLFLHYLQLLDGSGVRRLAARLGANLDRRFADRSLSHSGAGGAVPGPVAELYAELCDAAGHRDRERPST